jgi:hypothetical protein
VITRRRLLAGCAGAARRAVTAPRCILPANCSPGSHSATLAGSGSRSAARRGMLFLQLQSPRRRQQPASNHDLGPCPPRGDAS